MVPVFYFISTKLLTLLAIISIHCYHPQIFQSHLWPLWLTLVVPSACQSLAWIINLILARCVCARVCVREKYWTPLSFLHSEQAEGGFSVTYCYLLLPLAVSVSPSLYLPVSPSPITDSLNRFLFSACGIIPVTTEAPDNEILNSSHFLSLSASPAADAVPVRKDGDQVKCYYLLKKKKKINACTICCTPQSIFPFCWKPLWQNAKDTLVLASSALLLHLSALQRESGSMSVDFWPLKYYGGEKEALLLIQNCLLLLHSVALRNVKDPPPKIRGAAKKKCLPSSWFLHFWHMSHT